MSNIPDKNTAKEPATRTGPVTPPDQAGFPVLFVYYAEVFLFFVIQVFIIVFIAADSIEPH